jgi:hypothetical protein
MSDEYLWNRTGPPDEEVVSLEKLLGPLAYKEPKQLRLVYRRLVYRRPVYRWLAVAAMLLGALAFTAPYWRPAPLTDWRLASGARLRSGQLLETGADTGTTLESQFTGHLDIDPQSRLRLVRSAGGEQRFELQRGTLHALIWAPPGRFVVDTASAKTIDLGCRYTLQVAEDGTGLLSVETGWVAFEWQRRESFIPAGAVCITRPGRGPGTPWFADAPEPLRRAVSAFDTGADGASLAAALRAARPRDSLTVWHLMVRARGGQRAEAFERLANLVSLPAQVTREAVLRGDPAALDAAWNALNLGSTDWWREWKRKY